MTMTATRRVPAPGTYTPSLETQLERWIQERRDPAWKHKPYVVPATSMPPRLSAAALAELGKEHEYLHREHHDRRECTDAKSIEEFMERKHNQSWKYKPYSPPKPASMRLSDAARKAEEKRVRALASGR